MLDHPDLDAPTPSPQALAHACRWLGWAGVLLQALLGFVPLLVVVGNVLFGQRRSPMGGLSTGLWLAILCLVALLFSIYWCFRYTRLADRLETREFRPTKSQVWQNLWWGLGANLSIMALAVLIALWRVTSLTFKLLALPQGATVVVPAPVGTAVTPGTLITASDMIMIQAMVSAIAAGLVGTVIALLLQYQLRWNRPSRS